MKKTCLFTGGGSTGHVSVNLLLIPMFPENNWQVLYMGSRLGVERGLISQISQVRYYPIFTGKFRHYFSWENISDLFKILVGIFQAFIIIRKNKVDVVFSKGGFVSFPVEIAQKV